MTKKIISSFLFTGCILSLLMFTASCDWTSGGGGSDFNTSQGAGVNVNWSGVYFGQINGLAVSPTSAGRIDRFVLTQVGNRVEIFDNQGSKYVGNVGAPNLLRNPSSGVLPAGSIFVEAQIGFSGKDAVSGRDIDFVGVFDIIAVEQINGSDTTGTTTSTNGTSSSSSSGFSSTGQVVNIDGGGQVVEADPGSSTNVTGSGTSSTITTTTTTTFQVTERNSQFRLRGTWIEQEGVTAAVDAISPGGIATVTTTTQSTTTEN